MNNILHDSRRRYIYKQFPRQPVHYQHCGASERKCHPELYVKTCLEKGRRAAYSASEMAGQRSKEINYYEPSWKSIE